MKTLTKPARITAAALTLILATAAFGQTRSVAFPVEAYSPDSCRTVAWNGKMLKHHGRMINACQEVVVVGGEPWARFSAEFEKIDPKGKAVFKVRDHRGRFVETLKIAPDAEQIAMVDGRPTPFRRLEKRSRVSLYVPHSEFAASLAPCENRDGTVTQVIE
ncbi:MAG: hypothetical protein GVY11_02440 [Gammaproteobacteria bacterium]|jgi:hypothetical protein|nr:hypothetical protein [Gammaproteobacteria bacterium]